MPFKYKVQQGDTLNKISQRFGFTNFKEAGIKSVPSGNFDLIRPNEEIELTNYNPNEVKTISNTPDVISGGSSGATFTEGSNRLDTEQAIQDEASLRAEKEKSKLLPPPIIKTDGDTKVDTTVGDGKEATPRDAYLEYIKSKQAEADQAVLDAESAREERRKLFTTSLANIDATTQSTIDNINVTYDKRLEEQRRINRIKVGRVQAYGLSSGGRFTPLAFSDAVSNREQEASDKVSELEKERNNLINQAKIARDKGEVGLMSEKLKSLDDINEKLNKQLDEVDKEAKAQYNIFKKYNEEVEAEFQKKITESRRKFSAIAQNLIDEYNKDSDSFVKKYLENPNYSLSYADIVEIMNEAKYKKTALDLDTKGKESIISERKAKTKKALSDILLKKGESDALIKQRLASADASTALAEYRRRSTTGDDEDVEDFTSTEKKKIEQAGLKDATRQEKLDYIYEGVLPDDNAGGEDQKATDFRNKYNY